MTTAIPVTQLVAGLKILSTVNIKALIAAFESGSTETKVIDGLTLADDALKVIGLFIPPVAIAANDIEIAIEVEQVAEPFLTMVLAIPAHTLQPGEYSAWGHTFTGTVTQGSFT